MAIRQEQENIKLNGNDIGKVGQGLGLRQMSDEHQLEYARESTNYAPALFCTGVYAHTLLMMYVYM